MNQIEDTSTFSNFNEISVTHYDLSFDVDFDTETIRGVATLSLLPVNEQTPTGIHLDSWYLDISKVIDGEGRTLQYHLTQEEFDSSSDLHWQGGDLYIDIPENSALDQITIVYSTHPQSLATCWLPKEQTYGKQHPYLFTQGQAVLNRGLFPCQDTPAARATYSASVRVPKGLTAVMSAIAVSETDSEDGSKSVFHFEMKNRIPIYLLAFAVGNLVSKDLSSRSKVWSEPESIDACANEFDEIVDIYISQGEQLFGEYLWGRYDILIMPPAFPWGGMENSTLTFLSSTIVAGDKSLANVAAHEVSHSWFGNLITNGNWSEFWLNEGFTMYAERRIIEKVHGSELAELQAFHGLSVLKNEVNSLGETSEMTKLRPDITGMDPDDTYTRVPYEKGFALLTHLAEEVGGKPKFDEFLKEYVAKFKWQSIVAEQFFDFFFEYFEVDHLKDNVESYLYSVGVPYYVKEYKNNLITSIDETVNTWTESYTLGDIESWGTWEIAGFLDQLYESDKVTAEHVSKLSETINFNNRNCVVTFEWCKLIIKHQLVDLYGVVRELVKSTGRQTLLKPIYEELCKGSEVEKSFARELYDNYNTTMYHASVARNILKIINKDQ
eukprot:TRINITY_DN7479_c0_g1_i1.p1 TRINITY_DN7479_c0_g1~~TRINITY_DN7479_c0_g1_i1.p1  ORF type:complete len:609 (+),score=130.80 TRINITY_DN7479_c0_g1_i1:43-1869(+)